MDIEHLPSCLELYANSGNTLNLEKCNLLMNSLTVLQNENHFRKVFFWGQIHGLQEDYFIAFGYQKDALRDRRFYYSRNSITWMLLPVLKPNDRAHYLTYISTNRFFGNPSLQIEILDEQPPDYPEKFVPQADESSFRDSKELAVTEPKPSLTQISAEEIVEDYRLKEEDRLAAVVKFINQEAAIIPRGGLFKQTNGRIVPNPAFSGLPFEEATILTNFMHYRMPRERWELNVGRRPDYNYATDFFDTIAEDIPKNNAWSIELLQENTVVVLRSLYWHGFTFYHQLNTGIHGFLYQGYGQRNIDLPFMI